MEHASPSRGEELANTLSHGLGIGLSIAAVSLLAVFAALNGTARHVVSFSIYGATLVLLYTASTLYHSFRSPRIKRALRVCDHAAIYLLIAGTYTPFTLVVFHGAFGWTLFGIVWGLAATGVLLKLLFVGRFHKVAVGLYIAMGWLVVFGLKPLINGIATPGLVLMVVGGVLYTGGTVFYVSKRIPWNHAIWHLFVLGGSVCHFFAVLFYAPALGAKLTNEGAMNTFPDRPNVIWILGDQHRAQAVGCLGNDQLSTPHLDSLTDTPLTGDRGVSAVFPFRASMLAGRWPHECVPGHDVPIPDGTPMLTTPLREHGYHTAYFGKWHVDGDRNREPGQRPAFHTVRPERRGGFDVWLGYENNNAQYDSWLHGHDDDGNEIPHAQLPGYETDGLTAKLLAYLDDRSRSANQPFFAVLSVQPPHSPYVAPPEWLARHRPEDIKLRPNVPPVARVQDAARRDLAGYYAMIENLDWNVGRVLGSLRRNGLADNTIVVVFSDHGDMHGSHGLILKCVPYEESIRIPLLVGTASESFRLHASCDAPALLNHVDLPVTTLGLCGIDAPDWMRGADYSWCWRPDRPETPVPDCTLLQLVDPGWTNRFASDRERPWRGIVTRDGWKYAVLEGQPWLLFDLNEDPHETANLALDGRFAKPRRRLQARLAECLQATGDSFALPELP